MSSLAILIDFGSTFTKVTAVDLSQARVIGRSQSPSTVGTDVREGLLRALRLLHERNALFDQRPKDSAILSGKTVLASSSAAGGLRIAVVGNLPGLIRGEDLNRDIEKSIRDKRMIGSAN